MAEKTSRFLEYCVGKKVKYLDTFRKQIFEGTLEFDSNIGIYTIATGGRNKPIVCHKSAASDFIVRDGEIIDKNGRYETINRINLDEEAGLCSLCELDFRSLFVRDSIIEIETGRIIHETINRFRDAR